MCWLRLLQLSALVHLVSCTCEHVPSQAARVTHCRKGEGAGSFELYAPDWEDSAWVRGRVVGDATRELVFGNINNATWRAQYSLPRGRYRSFAEIHYRSFMSGMPKPLPPNGNLIFDDFAFEIESAVGKEHAFKNAVARQ